jgi:hypothetical protein
MNLTNRVEKLEQQSGVTNGVRFVAKYPPKMSREEWTQYARERRNDPNFFTVNLTGAEVSDEHSDQN